MSRYIRPKAPGASVFFTVNLVDRGADTLIRHVDVLRQAVAVTRAKRPFGIDAWVVLPDHMHCVWTLPEGDADYSGRMGEIKGQFTRALRRSGPAPTLAPRNSYGAWGWKKRVGQAPKEELGQAPTYTRMKPPSGKSGSGSITSGATRISRRMCGIVGSIR